MHPKGSRSSHHQAPILFNIQAGRQQVVRKVSGESSKRVGAGEGCGACWDRGRGRNDLEQG